MLLDQDNNGVISGGDSSISIYLGTPPNFDDSVASLNTYSGFNVIGNNDAGRYDTSAFAGGSPFTTYSSTLGLVGNLQVLRLGIVLDTFGSLPARQLNVSSLNAQFAPPVPEPGSIVLLSGGLLGIAGTLCRRLWK